jgi:PAS domain S-box-containing protein
VRLRRRLQRDPGAALRAAAQLLAAGQHGTGLVSRDDAGGIAAQLEVEPARFRAVFEQAPVGMALIGADGVILQANPKGHAILGFDPDREPLAARGFDFVLHPDERETVLSNFRRRIAGETLPPVSEWRLRRRDGTYAAVRLVQSVVRVAGVPPSLLVIVEDMTEQRAAQRARAAAEDELQQRRAQLDLALWASGIALWSWQPRENRLFLTPEWKAQLGFEDHEIRDDPAEWRERLHPEDVERTEARIGSVLNQPGEPYEIEFRMRHKSGDYRWILSRARVTRDAQGVATLLSGAHVDITELKRAERDRERLQTRLADLLDSMSASFIGLDCAWRYVFVNPGAERMFGQPADALIGRTLWSVFPDAVGLPFHAACEDVMRTRQPRSLDHFYCGKWYRNYIYPTSEGISIFAEDITHERRLQEQVRQSEEHLRRYAMGLTASIEDERQRIARELHDELGQVFTAIKIDTGWLDRQLRQRANPEVRERLAAMRATIGQAIGSMRRISAELRPVQLDDLGLQAAMEAQIRQFELRNDVACEARIDGALTFDSAQSIGLYRILQEALTNIARHSQASAARIVLEQQGDQVVLEVTDNGVGLGVPRAPDRASLGLLGIAERAQLLGGDARIGPGADGSGTRVRVTIPRPQATPLEAA